MAEEHKEPSYTFAKAIGSSRPEPKQTLEVVRAQKLLDWIQNAWTKPTITVREIRVYGPTATRSRESATSSTEILTKNNWLIPIKARRHDGHIWQVVRKPVLYPTVASVAAE
jgi:hypothetical protein